ncbi:MAG TPA: TolC family protein [Sphingobium sp.]
MRAASPNLILPSLLTALLAGCQAYRAAPVDAGQVAVQRQHRTADPEAVRAVQAHIAPGSPYDAVQWDRLTLFAALLAHNPDVAAASAAVDSARAGARAARAAPGPTLTLSSEYANDPSTSSPWLLGGGLDVPLDIGGRRTARITSAVLGVAVARYDYADALWAARMRARAALNDLMSTAREEAAGKRLLDYRLQQQAAMERRLSAGAVGRAELERIRVDATSAAGTLQDAHARHIAARQALAAAIGLPEVTAAGLTFLWPDYDVVPTDPGQSPLIRDRAGATVGRADVLKAVAAYDLAESDLRGEVARQYPAITLSPGYTWERGLVKLPFNLGLALPPLDLNRRAIAAAEARRTESGKRLETVVANANAALEAAINECREARVALDRIRTVDLPTARRLAAQADAQFRRGQIDRTDWAAAQSGVPQAEITEITALARVHTADAALEDAVRRPMEGPELMLIPGALEPQS